MINLDFTEKELDTLKEYFQAELLKTEQKIDSIKGILEKIGKKTGKGFRSEKKAAKKALKKMKAMAQLIEPEIKIRKKPGPKPKAEKVAALVTEAPEKKKRGRPPRVKEEGKRRGRPRVVKPVVEIEAEAKAESPVKTRRRKVAVTLEKAPAVAVEKTVRKRRPRLEKVAASSVPELMPKRKPGRPPKPAAEKKPLKPGPKAPKKKAVKIPWGAWITNVLRDSEENLSQQNIIDTIAKRLQLAGPELDSATVKILDQFNKLQKSGKVVAQQSGDSTLYGLKITGRRGR